jgi:hypothetical protein
MESLAWRIRQAMTASITFISISNATPALRPRSTTDFLLPAAGADFRKAQPAPGKIKNDKSEDNKKDTLVLNCMVCSCHKKNSLHIVIQIQKAV